MSHRKPTKTKFNDLWRDQAKCLPIAQADPSMETAWDNIETGTWKKSEHNPSPLAPIAEEICVNQCPVRELCLKDAISDNEADGLRGGYRFEFGTVSRRVAQDIFNEFGLRARVSRRTPSNVQDPQVPGVSESE